MKLQVTSAGDDDGRLIWIRKTRSASDSVSHGMNRRIIRHAIIFLLRIHRHNQQRTILRCFHGYGMNNFSLGVDTHLFKRCRLAHATQSNHKDTLVALPRPMRAIAMLTCLHKASRPASVGGGAPAPGDLGFVIGSIPISKFAKLSILDKRANFA